MKSRTLTIATQVTKPITIKVSRFVKEGTIVVNKRDAKIMFKILKTLETKAHYTKELMEEDED